MIFAKRKAETSSKFSEFIREASAREKKKVYSTVLKKASERQLEVLDKHARAG